MTDTTIIWNAARGQGDWTLDGAQLGAGNDLESAVMISLFTDRAATPDDVIPDASGDPRGWWGDAGQGAPIGSRLWLLGRAKQTTQTLNLARDYIAEALQWLIDDGVVARFDTVVEWSRAGVLGARIVALKPNGEAASMQFTWAWDQFNE